MSDTISSRSDQSPAPPGRKPLFLGVEPVLKLAVLVWLAVCLQAVASAQTTENWVGTDMNCLGCWSAGDNWDPPTAAGGPNGNFNVVISVIGPPQPILDVDAKINNLDIDEFQSLTINGGQLTVTGSTISNDGSIALSVNSTAFGSLIIKNTATLSGSGTVQLGPEGDIQGDGTLINQQLIFGFGSINVATLQNTIGQIQGTSPSQHLVIGASGKGAKTVLNTGFIGTQGSGTISIGPVTVQNAGGTISGGSGGAVLNGSTIIGGTLEGQVQPGRDTPTSVIPTLNGVTIGGTYEINSLKTYLVGTITNNGSIEVLGPKLSKAELIIDGDVTITGTGSVLVSGIYAFIMGSGTLTIAQTISGDASANITVKNLVNQGTVASLSTGSPFTIQVPGLITNTGGTFNAGSGDFSFVNTKVTGGTISVGSDIAVTLNGATLSGVTTSGLGMFNVQGSATLENITNSSNIEIAGGNTATLKGTIDNANMIFIDANSLASPANLLVIGDVKVTGGGTIYMSNITDNNIAGTGVGDTLDIVNNTIEGAGTINSLNLDVDAKGTINYPTGYGYPLVITPGSGNTFSLTGLLSETSQSGSVQVNGTFSNFNSGTNTLTGGSYDLAGGAFQFPNANIVTNAAKITLSGGQIEGLNGAAGLSNFSNNSSTGSFTVSGGQSFTTAGTFNNAGGVTVSKGSNFIVGGSGTSFNQTAGTTTVDGTLGVPVGGQVSITDGTLQGAGGFTGGGVSVGNASGSAATFIIGDSTKTSASVSIANDYMQLATGILAVQIGGTDPGTEYSQLDVTGPTSLQGTLNIKLINSFVPQVGQTFTVLTSPSIVGTFSTINGKSIGASEHFAIAYNPTSVVLTAETGP
jgi:hypothetical protein